MTPRPPKKPPRDAPGAAPAEPAAGRPDGSPRRVRHLFRVMTRQGLVHPLQHLLQRYRAGERG